ncbi:hypothetical protein ACN47E_010041 [Coniothyrium glycines]
MSGIEAITIIQLIDACIGITKTIIDVGRAVKDDRGLPSKLRDLVEALPAIEDLLESAREKCEDEDIPEDTSQSAKPILKQCEEALSELRDIIRKACPKDGENRSKRVWRGAKTVFFGGDSRVQKLLVIIQDNLKLLEQKEIYIIGDKLNDLQQIVEGLADDDGSRYTHTGAGSMFVVNEGGNQENYVGGGSNNRQINKPGIYHEGPTTYNYQTQLPPGEWNSALDVRDRRQSRDKFMNSLYRNACLYRETKDRNRRRIPGTCEWFTNHSLFKKWASATTDQEQGLLYITADPGCGKSVLSRYLIDEVLPLGDRMVCYFFFKDDFEDQKSCLRAVCTVMFQLFDRKPQLITDAILESFKSQGEKLFDSFINLWSIFVVAAAQQDTVCVFDALDECSAKDRGQLIDAITSLFLTPSSEMGNSSLKCLLTSRPYDHILRRIYRNPGSKLALIHLQGDQGHVAEEIVAEIGLVVNSRIDELVEPLRLSVQEQKWLRSTLKSIPNRTYLWITLIFDGLIDIETGVDRASILQMLERPPPTVDDAYEKMLNRSSLKQNARRGALYSILAAKRPLSLAEMSVVLGFQAAEETGNTQANAFDLITPQVRFREYLRDLCGLFVVVVDGNVYLLHQTAREFLLRPAKPDPCQGKEGSQLYVWKQSIDLVESNSFLAKICIKYLLSCLAQGNQTLLDYSTVNWIGHYQQSSANIRTQLAGEARDLCSSPETCNQWLGVYTKDEHRYLPSTDSPLCIAAYFGLLEAVQLLLSEHGHNPSNKESRKKSKRGRSRASKTNVSTEVPFKSFLKKLSHKPSPPTLEKEISTETSLAAYVNTVDSKEGRTPLFWAVSGGHEAVVKLLLDTGEVDVKKKDFDNWTPLLDAVVRGNKVVAKMLIDTGKVNINKKSYYGEAPLLIAADEGDEAIVKLLLDTGKVDVNTKDPYGQTPLWLAVKGAHKVVVKLLLDTGKVDVNTKHTIPHSEHVIGWSPLSLAIGQWTQAIVKLLLDTGKVDVNTKDFNGRTPLSLARESRNETVVKWLLDAGAIHEEALS